MSSGSTCSVVGCHNSSRKRKNISETFCLEHQKVRNACPCPPPYALHTMPRKEDRKLAWLAALRLKNPPKRIYVCSFHFIDKKPTELNPDPELYLGYDRPPPKKRRLLVRTTERQAATRNTKNNSNSVPDCAVGSPPVVPGQAILSTQPPPAPRLDSVHTQLEDFSQHDHTYCSTSHREDIQHKMTQSDEAAHFLLQNDTDSLRYTGLALKTFNALVSTLEGHNDFTMPVRDQVLMTLMKLKTSCVISDLSSQFHVAQSLANNIVLYWLDRLEEFLRPLIPWLPRETIQATMPAAFKKNFSNTACIIDCNEIVLQTPQNLGSKEESYNHYSNTTVKYMVAVAPCGLVMFVSETYSSRCSDQFIMTDSRFLTYLRPGDEVMADQDFTIKDLLFERQVRLVIPPFTKSHGQLSGEQETHTCQTEDVRIHVTRAIRRLKVYKILSQTVPLSMAPKIDKILRICAALVNLREDVIRDAD